MCFVAGAQTPTLTRFTFTEYLMGVDAQLIVYAKDRTAAEKACSAAFERIAHLDSIMSDYQKNSELMLLCDKAGGPPVKVSPDLFRILTVALEKSRDSGGMFDVTVGPLVKLWRAARKSHILPKPEEIAAARDLVGWQHVHLDAAAQTVQLDLADMRLDLGAIGKGYADDAAQKVLKQNGIASALVEMGGDMVVSGPPPGKAGWTIEVPNWVKHGPRILTLSNCAISSSGDTEQSVVIGGVKYSHVVNPHTGMALTQGVQATIIGRSGLECDGLATSLPLLDDAGRARLLKHYPWAKTYIRVLQYGKP